MSNVRSVSQAPSVLVCSRVSGWAAASRDGHSGAACSGQLGVEMAGRLHLAEVLLAKEPVEQDDGNVSGSIGNWLR